MKAAEKRLEALERRAAAMARAKEAAELAALSDEELDALLEARRDPTREEERRRYWASLSDEELDRQIYAMTAGAMC